MEFSYLNPTRIEFGQGKIASISTHIPKEYKVLFIYGGGSIKKNGVYNQVLEALKDYTYFEFSGVESNPTLETLDKAVALAKKEDVDYILAVGGGSVIDGSKYVANAFYYDGIGWDILEGKHISTNALPIGAVLTLAATGSESNTGSVITKAATREKRFFRSEHSFPKFAILDPNVLKSLDDRQIKNGLIDSFVHTCEQYLTYKHGMLAQDNYSEGILRARTLRKGFELQAKKRPDLRLDLGSHVLMVEVDEKQHKPYGCSCDNKRTMLLSQDVGHRPLIFIRFNPDQYIDKDGTKVPSCWKHGKDGIIRIQNDKDWGFRLGVLSEQIEYWIENSTDKLVEVVELFYSCLKKEIEIPLVHVQSCKKDTIN